MQDSYARAMEPFGLERGVKSSVAEHQTVKEFYAKIGTNCSSSLRGLLAILGLDGPHVHARRARAL